MMYTHAEADWAQSDMFNHIHFLPVNFDRLISV
jgi:hypothetical protein